MKKIADKNDEEWDNKCEEIIEEENKIKGFSKLWPYQRPLYILPIAVLASIVSGFSHLLVGVAFSKMMPILALPLEYVKAVYP